VTPDGGKDHIHLCCGDCKAIRFISGKLYSVKSNITLQREKTYDGPGSEENDVRLDGGGQILMFLRYQRPKKSGNVSWGSPSRTGTDLLAEFLYDDKVVVFTGGRCTGRFERLKI